MVYDVIVVVDDHRTAPSRDVREIIGSIDFSGRLRTTTYLSNQSVVVVGMGVREKNTPTRTIYTHAQ